MSTVKSKKVEVDIIQPRVVNVTQQKRGPKHRHLPDELINELAKKDMGAKAISSWLRDKQGVKVSYKTIQRILKGERQLL